MVKKQKCMKKRLWGLCLLLWTAALPAQTPTIETMLSAPFPSDLTADAEGDRFAWVFNDRGQRNIWLAGPEKNARALTDYEEDDGQGISALQFVPGQNALLYVRGAPPTAPENYPIRKVSSQG